ncbi:hypothetical protein V8G54_035380 [Vigna mungo]|uniref:N-acetyltransferase domain-containing protein n=1 Tax=Vigna mungo TaxID=3915 RepID=A0AAQ3MEW6_VIGMU
MAYYSDICVGAIACRLEKKEGGGQVRVYIMTLGVLAPYRGLGIGTKLLNHALDLCSKQNISEVYLHVQTNNEDAINFYKKFGFEITETIQNYYTNITPPDCYVLTRNNIIASYLRGSDQRLLHCFMGFAMDVLH